MGLMKTGLASKLSFPKKKYIENNDDRSSRPEVLYKKGVFRNFAKFTGKHLCQKPFFNKVAGQGLELY